MDIYRFLPSPDVAEYCKKIGHVFNPVEMAYLIEQSGRTINEKNMLFQELVDDYPDMQFHKSVKFPVRSSLHTYLRALIKWNKIAMEFFYHPHRETRTPLVYTVCGHSLGELGLGPKINPLKDFMKKPTEYKSFKTVGELLEDIRPHWDREKLRDVRVFVKRMDQAAEIDFTFYADVNFEGEIIGLDDAAVNGVKHPGNLWELFVHIPVPFQAGDIVSSSAESGEIPYVLKTLPQCEKEPIQAISGAHCDYYESQTDIPAHATFYYLTQDGHLADSFPCFEDPWRNGRCLFTYHLQRYQGKFEGDAEILPCLSDYIKQNGTERVPEWAQSFRKGKSISSQVNR